LDGNSGRFIIAALHSKNAVSDSGPIESRPVFIRRQCNNPLCQVSLGDFNACAQVIQHAHDASRSDDDGVGIVWSGHVLNQRVTQPVGIQSENFTDPGNFRAPSGFFGKIQAEHVFIALFFYLKKYLVTLAKRLDQSTRFDKFFIHGNIVRCGAGRPRGIEHVVHAVDHAPEQAFNSPA